MATQAMSLLGLAVIAYLVIVAWVMALQGKPVSYGWLALIGLCIAVREMPRFWA